MNLLIKAMATCINKLATFARLLTSGVCLLDTAAFKSVSLFNVPCEHIRTSIRQSSTCTHICVGTTTPQQAKSKPLRAPASEPAEK